VVKLVVGCCTYLWDVVGLLCKQDVDVDVEDRRAQAYASMPDN